MSTSPRPVTSPAAEQLNAASAAEDPGKQIRPVIQSGAVAMDKIFER